jgi:hypothetical protein
VGSRLEDSLWVGRKTGAGADGEGPLLGPDGMEEGSGVGIKEKDRGKIHPTRGLSDIVAL